MRRYRAAFTLVELMAVVAVLAILMALVLPGIQGAREVARSSICKSNLRQLHIAYNELKSVNERLTIGLPHSWAGKLSPYLQEQSATYICPSNTDTQQANAWTPPGAEGKIVFLDEVPPSLKIRKYEAEDAVRVFREVEDFELPQGLPVDIATPGEWGYQTAYTVQPGTIPAGTRVDVYLLHFDPVNNAPSYIFESSIHFSTRILGVQIMTDKLNDSDHIFGKPGTEFDKHRARGFEREEACGVTEDMKQFQILRFRTPGYMEEARIIVEPGSAFVTTYGMNRHATSSQSLRPRQVLFTDYDKPTLDLVNDWRVDAVTRQRTNKYLDFRHFGQVNVLYGDGSVKSRPGKGFFDMDQPHWKPRGG